MFFVFSHSVFRREIHDQSFIHFSHDLYPAINLYEKEHELILEALIPGAEEDSILIGFDENTICLSGFIEKKAGLYHRQESHVGQFFRQIPISCSIRREKVKRNYKDGVLLVIFSKLPNQRCL